MHSNFYLWDSCRTNQMNSATENLPLLRQTLSLQPQSLHEALREEKSPRLGALWSLSQDSSFLPAITRFKALFRSPVTPAPPPCLAVSLSPLAVPHLRLCHCGDSAPGPGLPLVETLNCHLGFICELHVARMYTLAGVTAPGQTDVCTAC